MVENGDNMKDGDTLLVDLGVSYLYSGGWSVVYLLRGLNRSMRTQPGSYCLYYHPCVRYVISTNSVSLKCFTMTFTLSRVEWVPIMSGGSGLK